MTPAQQRSLQEAGISTVHDLLRHYPRRHEDRRKFPSFPVEADPEPVCLRGTVVQTKMIRFGRRCQFTLTLAEAQGGALCATVRCRWFNLRYLSKILQAGQDLVIHGRGRPLKRGGLVFDHPDFEVLETSAPDSELIHLNRIAPVYPSLGPFSPRTLRRMVFEILAQLQGGDPPEACPAAAGATLTYTAAIHAIHFPGSWESLEAARTHLARGELFEMQCVLGRQRRRHMTGAAPVIARRSSLLAQFLKGLPFALTGAQKRVLTDVFDDLGAGKPMNRLLHGDVGSGKTIVAAVAMLATVAAGRSAALMAPTQVLAHQHYGNFRKLFDPLGVPVVLRTATRSDSRPSS